MIEDNVDTQPISSSDDIESSQCVVFYNEYPNYTKREDEAINPYSEYSYSINIECNYIIKPPISKNNNQDIVIPPPEKANRVKFRNKIKISSIVRYFDMPQIDSTTETFVFGGNLNTSALQFLCDDYSDRDSIDPFAYTIATFLPPIGIVISICYLKSRPHFANRVLVISCVAFVLINSVLYLII